jgi:uncharacterized protein YbjT (DUF2867 family)
MTCILVIGASRGVGLATVKRALKAGHTVRALARTADAIPVNDPHLTKITADAHDAAALAQAMAGVDAVVLTLGTTKLFATITMFSRITEKVIAAMRSAGVRRLIVLTGLGAGDSRGRGGFFYDHLFLPLLLDRIYRDKTVQEEMVKASGLDWVIARPGFLTNGRRTEAYAVLVEPHEWHGGAISRADVADFLVKQVTSDTYLGTTPVLVDK